MAGYPNLRFEPPTNSSFSWLVQLVDLVTDALSTARGASVSGFAFLASKGTYALLYIWIAALSTPADLGTITFGLAVYAMFSPFRDFGLTPALISRRDLSQGLVSSVLSVRFIIAAVLLIIGILLSFLLPLFFAFEGLTTILLLVAMTLWIEPIGFLSAAFLQRELKFRKMAIADILSVAAMAGVAIPMTLMDFESYALFGGLVGSAAARTVACLSFRPVKAAFSRDIRQSLPLIRFGGTLVAAGILVYFYYNMNVWVLGSLDPVALGLYGFAFLWASAPADIASGATSRVLIPTYSAIKGDQARVVRGYLKSLRYLVILSLGAFLALLAVAPITIEYLYGSEWDSTVPILQVLLLFGAMRTIAEPAGSLLLALEKPGIFFASNLVGLVLMAAFVYPVAVEHAALGASALLDMTYLGYLCILWFLVLRLIGESGVTLVQAVRKPVLSAAASLALAFIVILATSVPEELAFLCIALPSYFALLYLFGRDDLRQAIELVKASIRVVQA